MNIIYFYFNGAETLRVNRNDVSNFDGILQALKTYDIYTVTIQYKDGVNIIIPSKKDIVYYKISNM